MKLLLDTHIWLWALTDLSQLSPAVRREVGRPENEVWLSPVSSWEALLLHSKGRLGLRITTSVRDWLVEATSYFREAPLTHEIVLRSQELALPQQDPADRFLAATASALGLTLVTQDRELLKVPGISTLANH